MLRSRPAPSHRWSSWLLLLAPRRPGRGRRRPAQAQLLGHRPVAVAVAIWSLGWTWRDPGSWVPS